jgi:GNAT superfamily N-acetyltransferase
MSIYAAYLKEREDAEVLETPRGFVVYRITPSDNVYVKDIYVLPDYRKTGEASRLANRVADLAREQSCCRMFGSVDPTAHGADVSMRALLGYGMRPAFVRDGLVFFRKEIHNDRGVPSEP